MVSVASGPAVLNMTFISSSDSSVQAADDFMGSGTPSLVVVVSLPTAATGTYAAPATGLEFGIVATRAPSVWSATTSPAEGTLSLQLTGLGVAQSTGTVSTFTGVSGTLKAGMVGTESNGIYGSGNSAELTVTFGPAAPTATSLSEGKKGAPATTSSNVPPQTTGTAGTFGAVGTPEFPNQTCTLTVGGAMGGTVTTCVAELVYDASKNATTLSINAGGVGIQGLNFSGGMQIPGKPSLGTFNSSTSIVMGAAVANSPMAGSSSTDDNSIFVPPPMWVAGRGQTNQQSSGSMTLTLTSLGGTASSAVANGDMTGTMDATLPGVGANQGTTALVTVVFSSKSSPTLPKSKPR
jgi:hypothetical protein